MSIITLELLAHIKKHYRLNWMGTHGIMHWHRVYMNGVKLSTQDGVNDRVVQLFSIFHDSQRKNEHWDRKHGKRGAKLAIKLRNYVPLDDVEFELLVTACELHTNTMDHDNITVQACFDSDRLDLGRVGHYPDPNRLCTAMAKDETIIKLAYHRSRNNNKLPDHPFGLSDFSTQKL